MWRVMRYAIGLLLIPALLCAASFYLRPQEWAPRYQAKMSDDVVYAYRQWQSMGIDVQKGDIIRISAQGEWMYSPYVGLHGPQGGGKPVTVSTYPSSTAHGGALLGRIGDEGPIFYVGRGTIIRADTSGRLYFRINDDLLGDNKGYVTLDINVQTPDDTGQ